MTSLTRKEISQGVLANLRAVGPQTVEEVRADLGITKRQAEDAIWLLGTQNHIEYDYPVGSPPRYKVSS